MMNNTTTNPVKESFDYSIVVLFHHTYFNIHNLLSNVKYL